MIRPSNIDIENHTADFKCDTHEGTVAALNVNSELSYTPNDKGIVILGSVLSSPCNCQTTFPNEADHITEQVAELSQAKTE